MKIFLIILFVLLLPSTSFADGRAVFGNICASCHLQGLNGAPKFGNRADWASRIKEGKLDLIAEAYGGIRLMPAKGGKPDLSIEDFSAAAVYMANEAGANWQIPNENEYQRMKRKLKNKEPSFSLK